jgi:RnfABCDGE-type electron transport complex B subunit
MTHLMTSLAEALPPVPYLGAAVLLALVGAFFGLLLYVGSRVFAVEVDPRIDQIEDALSGANCGACGYGGCRAYAEAVATKGEATNLCAPGGADTCGAIAKIMGVEAEAGEAKVAVVHCKGTAEVASQRGAYAGISDCRAALVPAAGGGAKRCPHGCLGLGTCAAACPFDALVMGPDGLPLVIEQLCTGCGKCVDACPRAIIALHPKSQHTFVLCSSHLKGKAQKEACSVGCIGCRKCVKECEYGAVAVTKFRAQIDDDKRTNCGACVMACPQNIIWSFKKARDSYAQPALEAAATCPE